MSILSSVLELIGIGIPRGESNAIDADDRGDSTQSSWNDSRTDRDDNSKHGDNDDYSRHASGWKDARHNEYQPQKDDCDPNPFDDSKDYRSAGEALAKLDFSHGDFRSHGPDQSGDMLGALASMSPDDALEYAIGKMGPADHFDVVHFDVGAETSHDTDA